MLCIQTRSGCSNWGGAFELMIYENQTISCKNTYKSTLVITIIMRDLVHLTKNNKIIIICCYSIIRLNSCFLILNSNILEMKGFYKQLVYYCRTRSKNNYVMISKNIHQTKFAFKLMSKSTLFFLNLFLNARSFLLTNSAFLLVIFSVYLRSENYF